MLFMHFPIEISMFYLFISFHKVYNSEIYHWASIFATDILFGAFSRTWDIDDSVDFNWGLIPPNVWFF